MKRPTHEIATAEAEIVALHRLIAGWVRGRKARTLEEFSRLGDHLLEEFSMVPADGYRWRQLQETFIGRLEVTSAPTTGIDVQRCPR